METHGVQPQRALLPSPIEKTPPSAKPKRALGELSINVPPRSASAQDFTTPDHPSQFKKHRKASEPSSAPHSASSFASSTSKRDSPNEDSVWGPEVEAAFMSAISSIPKLGRRKICIGSKPCGRNELIADYIYRRTGKVRTRKQVSSHIQVLKHLRRDDLEFLALVADGKDEDIEDGLTKFEPLSTRPGMQFSGKQNALERSLSSASRLLGNDTSMPPARTNLKIEDFCIWATKRGINNGPDQVSHVYSQLGDNENIGCAPIDAIKDWALRFPSLPALVADQYTPPCPIFHLRSMFALPQALDLGGQQQIVLRTQLALSCVPHQAREQWACNTKVYTMGNEVLNLRQKVSMEQLSTIDESGTKCKVGLKVAVPFATDFWAAFLAGLATLDQPYAGMNESERLQKRDRDAQTAISGITIVQEIITVETSLEASRRVSILIWEFGKVSTEGDAETTATRIILPEQTQQQMQHHLMSRSISQPASATASTKMSRPGLASGGSLQRSQSTLAVPTQAYDTSFSNTYGVPQKSIPNTSIQTHLPFRHPGHVPSSSNAAAASTNPINTNFYQPIFDQPAIPTQHAYQFQQNHPHHLNLAQHTVPSNGPAPSAMARSFSAPTWSGNTAPAQFTDLTPWGDAAFDWNIRESSSYLQNNFEIASDDFFSSTPSRSQSTVPISYAMEASVSNEETDENNSAMPRLGFFPLSF